MSERVADFGQPGSTLFVGLGAMGEPMATRHAAALPTLVHDRDSVATDRLVAATAASALPDLARVPSWVTAVVLMLPDSRAVEAVLLGADALAGPGDTDGLLAQLRPGALVVDMGSSEPASTRRLSVLASRRGIGYVDAPVSGGVGRARTGELAIMVGGAEGDVRRARPHLEPLGTSIMHVGPSGSGHAAKALNNLLSATNLAAAAEVLCIAQREGIDPAVMVEVLNSSTGRSQATEVKYPNHVLTGSFASGFGLDLMLKDLAIAQSLAQAQAATVPVTETAVRTLVEARQVLARDGLDHTQIVAYYERLNHALLRTGAGDDTERTDA